MWWCLGVVRCVGYGVRSGCGGREDVVRVNFKLCVSRFLVSFCDCVCDYVFV